MHVKRKAILLKWAAANQGHSNKEYHAGQKKPTEWICRNQTQQNTNFYSILTHTNTPLVISLEISGHMIQMEVNTGASISLISEQQYKQLWNAPTLEKSSVNLQIYTGVTLLILASINVTATYNHQTNMLLLFVIKGDVPNLMGCDWLAKFQLDWQSSYIPGTGSQQDRQITC